MTDQLPTPLPCEKCGSANVTDLGHIAGTFDDGPSGPMCRDCGRCVTAEDMSVEDAYALWNKRAIIDTLTTERDTLRACLTAIAEGLDAPCMHSWREDASPNNWRELGASAKRQYDRQCEQTELDAAFERTLLDDRDTLRALVDRLQTRITLSDIVAIPTDVARCPECYDKLSFEVEEWDASDGSFEQKDIYLHCERDDGTHGAWHSGWGATKSTVYAWARDRYRVETGVTT